jgi:flagellar basal body-associated protein FliL
MAEEAEKKESSEQESPAAAPGRKKVVILGVAVGMLLLGIGAPLAFMLLTTPEVKVEEPVIPQPIEELDPVAEGEGEESEAQEGEELIGAIVPLETFLANLSGGKYIRLQLQAELETPDVPKRFYSRLVPIRDEIIAYLTQQSAESLETPQGKEKLKGKVREIINQNLRREDVRTIYFTQFVIQ